MIKIDKETTYIIGLSEDVITELLTFLRLTLDYNVDGKIMPYEYTKVAHTLYDELNKL